MLRKKQSITIRKMLILQGASGHSFFFQETLLAQGLAAQVDLVSQRDEAIEKLMNSGPYSLTIIDLNESRDTGMHLGFWINQHQISCPVMLIVPSDLPTPLLAGTPFVTVPTPMSLDEFANRVREVLSQGTDK